MQNAVSVELDRLTSIQNTEYHTTNDVHKSLTSEFLRPVSVGAWYSKNDVPLPKVESRRDGSVVHMTYNVFPTQSYITNAELRFAYPKMSVLTEKYPNIYIRPAHNSGIAPIINGEFFVGELSSAGSLPNFWQNANPQFNRNPGAGSDRNFNLCVGNDEHREEHEWTQYIPRKRCNIKQGYGLMESTDKNIPVFLCYKDTRLNFAVYFMYQFELAIDKLVCMAEKQADGSMKSIKFNKLYVDCPKLIDIPNLYVNFSYASDNEVAFIKSEKLFDKAAGKGLTIRRFFRDVGYHVYNDGVPYGTEHVMDIESKSPVLALCYAAEGKHTKETYNIHANFTSNFTNVHRGYNMIKESSLMYGSIPKFSRFEPDQLELGQPRDHAPCMQMDPGYNFYALCNKPFSDQVSPGVVMVNRNTTLKIKVENTDPRLDDTEDNKEENEEEENGMLDGSGHDDEERSGGFVDDATTRKRLESVRVMEQLKKKLNKKYIIHIASLNLRTMEIKKSEKEEGVYNFMFK